jgi:hypothetical protein
MFVFDQYTYIYIHIIIIYFQMHTRGTVCRVHHTTLVFSCELLLEFASVCWRLLGSGRIGLFKKGRYCELQIDLCGFLFFFFLCLCTYAHAWSFACCIEASLWETLFIL